MPEAGSYNLLHCDCVTPDYVTLWLLNSGHCGFVSPDSDSGLCDSVQTLNAWTISSNNFDDAGRWKLQQTPTLWLRNSGLRHQKIWYPKLCQKLFRQGVECLNNSWHNFRHKFDWCRNMEATATSCSISKINFVHARCRMPEQFPAQFPATI